MVCAWPEQPSAKPAEPSAGVCDGQGALAPCTSEANRNWRPIDHKSSASSLAYEATKHTLVLIALVLVLHTTKFYGPWHQAKNIYREKAQPLLLFGC
jgi:hypothetical protein